LFVGGPLDGQILAVDRNHIHATHMLESAPVMAPHASLPSPPKEMIYRMHRVPTSGEEMLYLFKPEDAQAEPIEVSFTVAKKKPKKKAEKPAKSKAKPPKPKKKAKKPKKEPEQKDVTRFPKMGKRRFGGGL
jgi:hypothetical protein